MEFWSLVLLAFWVKLLGFIPLLYLTLYASIKSVLKKKTDHYFLTIKI